MPQPLKERIIIVTFKIPYPLIGRPLRGGKYAKTRTRASLESQVVLIILQGIRNENFHVPRSIFSILIKGIRNSGFLKIEGKYIPWMVISS